MDSQKLAQMLETIQQERLNLHSLLVIRHGYMVSETYFAGYDADNKHAQYSCTKSVVSTLIGIALDQGSIDSLAHPVLDYFSDRPIENRDPQKESMKFGGSAHDAVRIGLAGGRPLLPETWPKAGMGRNSCWITR